MQDFTSLGLPEKLMQSLNRMQFTTPTPIQAAAIPVALEGRDILGSAQTGTGKTGAFGIPLVAKLMENEFATALVMTPTRELAVQVAAALQQMIPVPNIRTAVLIGGEPMPKQFRQLQQKPRLIVGTPGRINDHLNRGTLSLKKTEFLVLDETDRMLDMGFGVQIDAILEHMPSDKRQTMLFSATLPQEIIRLSSKYLKNPQRIAVGSTSSPVTRIKQDTIQLAESEKYTQLVAQVSKREGSIIVFVKTKHGADRLADRLVRAEHGATAIHGDLRQSQRDRVIREFRDRKHRILVATDVAARGLDIPHIETVINYDLPQVPEDYIHRIGRTARAGAEGEAVNLLTPADNAKWRAIMRLISPDEQMPRHKDEGRSNGGGRKFTSGRKPGGNGKSFGKSWGEPKRKEWTPAGEGQAAAEQPKKEWIQKGERSEPRRERPAFADGGKPSFRKDGERSFEGKKPFFKKDGERKQWGDRDGGKPAFKQDGERKQWGNRDGAAKPAFKQDGERKQWGNRDGAAKPAFKQDGERKQWGNRDGGKPAFKQDGERKQWGNRDGAAKPAFKQDGERKQWGNRDTTVKKQWGDKKPASTGNGDAPPKKKHYGDRMKKRTAA